MTATRSASTRSLSGDGDDAGKGGILLVAGEGMLTTFPLVSDEVVIGRGAECDVMLAHASLSRRHALLRLGPPLTVEDLGSKNGTQVARKKLAPGVAAPLAVGESFHIGRFSFVLVRAPRSRTLSTQHGAEALRVLDPTGVRPSALLSDLAASGINALIVGETGVGKEMLAETLHRLSRRAGALVCVNCAAIAPALIESELFGHERGAFTGAAHERAGLLEAADGGTVFLDEVGELPLEAQAKLLRAIERREVLRVGAVKPIALDVRFVAATNRDLSSEIAAGSFRSDLYFRIDGVTLVVPPLRERRDQIGPLAVEFLRAAHEKHPTGKTPQLAADVLDHLRAYDWPGNVRELKAVLERAVLLARGGEIGVRHLALSGSPRASTTKARSPAADVMPIPRPDGENEERRRILSALEHCHGNQTRAAKHLGISRATLVNRLSLYNIPRPRK
jgi:DNA-binding NtrC family response regulator